LKIHKNPKLGITVTISPQACVGTSLWLFLAKFTDHYQWLGPRKHGGADYSRENAWISQKDKANWVTYFAWFQFAYIHLQCSLLQPHIYQKNTLEKISVLKS
jgi:hypothetical protein